MAREMAVHATLGTGLRFDVETGTGHSIVLDNPGPDGEPAAGSSPMSLLLAGLAGCSGMDIISILRKKRQDVTAYEIFVHGIRREEHPQIFTQITIEHVLTGHAIQPAAVEHAIQLTEERYCGVSATLNKTAVLTSTYRILEAP